MPAPKVLIIGCGVAGPVIALFLKRKGYYPVVVERAQSLGYEGSALSLAPNGLKVLSALGLSKKLTEAVPHCKISKDFTWDGDLLVESTMTSNFVEKYGQPAVGILRSFLNRSLKEALSSASIPLICEFKVSGIVEGDDKVTITAEDGRKEEGSFVIGCDGLNSVVSATIIKSHGLPVEPVEFTGIVQNRGISPTPKSMLAHPNTVMFFYGPSSYFTYYPVTSTSILWALYQRPKTGASEWPESRFMTSLNQEGRKEELLEILKDWPEVAKEVVRDSGDLIFLRVCDRKVLPPEHWYSAKGRCVVLGDAAHPLTPHIGQGANQALEDAWHLAQLLPTLISVTPPTTPPTTDSLASSELKVVFEAFARKRQPRTASLMNISRGVGELKCATSPEEQERRNRYYRGLGNDLITVEKTWDDWFNQPFS